jgi:very-short-patch-repair endonuclease
MESEGRGSVVARSWAALPAGRVIRLTGAYTEIVSLPAEPLPDAAPAVVAYVPPQTHTVGETVSAVLAELEKAAIELFPAWLPGGEGITGAGGATVPTARALALRTASISRHFGPFLADLAERSLRGTARRSGFPAEVRAAGLARVLAASFGRDRAAILVRVPQGLSPAAGDVLVAAAEWLAHRGGFGVWLTGAPLTADDRLETVTVRLPGKMAGLVDDDGPPLPDEPSAPGLTYPPVAGRPHPASAAERRLEAALTSYAWASGRAWNQTHQSNPLTNPIRVDLLWHAERCVVEIDGPEHLGAHRCAEDRERDLRLRNDGYEVLRFTNDQVLGQIDAVLARLERFLQTRRSGMFEGTHHAR